MENLEKKKLCDKEIRIIDKLERAIDERSSSFHYYVRYDSENYRERIYIPATITNRLLVTSRQVFYAHPSPVKSGDTNNSKLWKELRLFIIGEVFREDCWGKKFKNPKERLELGYFVENELTLLRRAIGHYAHFKERLHNQLNMLNSVQENEKTVFEREKQLRDLQEVETRFKMVIPTIDDPEMRSYLESGFVDLLRIIRYDIEACGLFTNSAGEAISIKKYMTDDIDYVIGDFYHRATGYFIWDETAFRDPVFRASVNESEPIEFEAGRGAQLRRLEGLIILRGALEETPDMEYWKHFDIEQHMENYIKEYGRADGEGVMSFDGYSFGSKSRVVVKLPPLFQNKIKNSLGG